MKCSDFDFVSKPRPTGFSDIADKGCKKNIGVKDDSSFWTEQLESNVYHLLNLGRLRWGEG